MSDLPENLGATDPEARPPLGGQGAAGAAAGAAETLPPAPPAGEFPSLGGSGTEPAQPRSAAVTPDAPPLPAQPGPPASWGGTSIGAAAQQPPTAVAPAVGVGFGPTVPGTGGPGGVRPDAGAAPDSEGSGVDRKFIAVAVAALLVVALIAAGAAFLLRKQKESSNESATASSTTTTTTSPKSTTTEQPGSSGSTTTPSPSTTGAGGAASPGGSTTTAPADPQRTAEVDEIVAFVEETRGLKFKTPPVVAFEDDSVFEQKLLKDFDEEVPDIEKQAVSLHALGLVPADVDLVETTKSMLGAGVVGFYDPETKELYVRGSELTPYVKTVVAHELVHALDDQHFTLDRPKLDEATDETGYAFTVLTEGSAKYVEEAYRDQMSAADQQAVADEENAPPDPRLLSIPAALLKMIWAPYAQGPELIASLVDGTSMAGVDTAFGEPPVSSEQTMTPEKYAADDLPESIAKPELPNGATEVDAGTFGQFMTTLLLAPETEFEIVDPDPAVENWDGDKYLAYTDGNDRECISVNTKMDSIDDATRLEQALIEWASQLPDAQVETTGTIVTFTSCVDGGSSGGGSPF